MGQGLDPKGLGKRARSPAGKPVGSDDTARGLRDLARLIQKTPDFPAVIAALKVGRSATIDGAWGSAGPLSIAAIASHAPAVVLVVIPPCRRS